MIVLIATDGTHQAEHALREAARLLPLKQARVFLVSVAPLAQAVASGVPLGAGGAEALATTVMPAVIAQLEQTATQHVADAVKLLEEQGIEATPLERLGEPAEEILAAAHEVQADLIVVGSHGYVALMRLVMGSVSDRVAHRAASAVLIVHPRPGEEG